MPEIVFPRTSDGRRSTAALGRDVVADALRPVDPAAADTVTRESDWRTGYLPHFRTLVEAGLRSPAAAYEIAAAGLASLRARMAVTTADGDRPLPEVFDGPAGEVPETETVVGGGTAEREVTLPYGGELLRGDALQRRLDAWVQSGAVEPSCAEMVRAVAASPQWLDLSDLRIVVLGAGSEMGPLGALLGWGATVAGVDLPRSALQERIRAVAASSAGTLLAPRGGADLLSGLPAVRDWLSTLDGRLVLGSYVYAPGADHVRLSAAVDALGVRLREDRPDLALAMLATPTDVFAVPPEAVAQADARYRKRSAGARAASAVSGGRLLRPNYHAGVEVGISDSLVAQQGPNYALAKRIQRWRATLARRDGLVSMSVAPPARTRSVLGSRVLAAAYAGAHLFDVEVFEPATANKLMAILLVHDLRNPRPAAAEAWRDEAAGAAHGGLWRCAYLPRTALGLAAVRGLPAALKRP